MFLFVELEDNDEEETESETTIFVKNLNFDTTEDSLKKVEIVFLVSQEMMEALISLLTHLLWYFVPASFSNNWFNSTNTHWNWWMLPYLHVLELGFYKAMMHSISFQYRFRSYMIFVSLFQFCFSHSI